MKRTAMCILAVGVLVVSNTSADASDLTKFLHKAFGTGHYSNHHASPCAAQRAHARHVAELERRAIERDLVHRAAHQHPLTRGQHARLHSQLERAAYYDDLERRSAHAARAYSQPSYQAYRAPYGYNAQYRSSQFGRSLYDSPVYRLSEIRSTQYGPNQILPPTRCSPYGRY